LICSALINLSIQKIETTERYKILPHISTRWGLPIQEHQAYLLQTHQTLHLKLHICSFHWRSQLMGIIDSSTLADTGRYVAWDGTDITF
jgi:hypothetical protein